MRQATGVLLLLPNFVDPEAGIIRELRWMITHQVAKFVDVSHVMQPT